MVKKILFAILAAALTVPVFAALTSSTVPSHNHSSAAQGGSAVAPASVTATGPVSGATVTATGAVSGATVTATGPVSGATVTATGPVSGATVTATGAVTGGSVATSGTVSSTKPCATGYARVAPNHCHRGGQAAGSVTAAVRNTCVAIPSPSSEAKALLLWVNASARSANAVLQRYVQINFFANSGCTTQIITGAGAWSYAYEHVAVAAGTTLDINFGEWAIYSGAAGGATWFTMYDDVGDQGTGAVYVVGYFD